MLTGDLSKENDCLYTNNQQLIKQIKELTDKLYEKSQEIQSLNYSITEQKVSFMHEMNKNNQIVELLNERINQLQELDLVHAKEDEDISLQDTNNKICDEAEYMKINHELRSQVKQLIEELESKLPVVQNLEVNNKDLKARLISNIDLLDSVSNENQRLTTENVNLSQKFQNASQMIKELVTQKQDLCQQIQHLLSKETKDNTTHENNSNSEFVDSQNVISSQLVSFDNIEELQKQNIKLITTIRNLTEMFENNSNKNANDEEEKKKMQNEISNLHNKIEVLLTENDSFKVLVNDNKLIAQQRENEHKISDLSDQLILQENKFKQKIAEITEISNEKEITLTKKCNELQFVLKEKENLSNELKELQRINEQLRKEHQHMKLLCAGFEDDMVKMKGDLASYKSNCQANESKLACLNEKLNVLNKDKEQLEMNVKLYQEEKYNLEIKLLSVKKESPSNESELIEKLKTQLRDKDDSFVKTLQEYKNLYHEKERNLKTTIERLNDQVVWLQGQVSFQSIPSNDDKAEITPKGKTYEVNVKETEQVSNSFISNESFISESDMLTKEADNDTNIIITKLQEEKNLYENKIAALNLEVDLLKGQIELLHKKENSSVTKNIEFATEITNDEFRKIMNDLNELNLLKNKMQNLNEELSQMAKDKSELEIENQKLGQINKSNQLELQTCKNDLLVAMNNVALYKEETKRWKDMTEQLKNPKQIQTLSDQVAKLKADLEAKTNENVELEDRFNRLKRQAHEKLDASKTTSAQLSSEVNELTSKQAELQLTVARYKEMEIEYNNKKNEFSELQRQFNETNERLKTTELKLEDSHKVTTDLEQKMKEMQQEFEERKKDAIEKVTEELKSKYENVNDKNNISSVDLDKMKDEWEKETQVRIEEAKENLKRRIRLPTEEKIKKVIDKRRNVLETEFEERVEEKAKALKLSDELKKPVEDIVKELEQKIKNRIEEEFNNTLKKKAFEEGKHQASMRTTLLERKLAKLEAQLEGKLPSNDRMSAVSQQRKSVSGLSKIDINNPFQLSGPKLNVFSNTSSTNGGTGGPLSSELTQKNPFSSTASPFKQISTGNSNILSSAGYTQQSPFGFLGKSESKIATNATSGSEKLVESSDEKENKRKSPEINQNDSQLKKLKSVE